jgi:maltose/moltooligosaccharide transporter
MAIAAQEGTLPEAQQSVDLDRKPPLTFTQILLMNFGFFGIQYSFGLQQTAINPIYELLGADPAQLPLLNLAGPVTGLFVQPLIGAMSDRTWSPRWGRRKPFFLVGAIGCSICLFLWPFVFALWLAFILLWLLDISNNTAMEPYRAFISDKLPKSQFARGFLTQSMFVGAGAVTANLSLFVFQRLLGTETGGGLPTWVFVAFWIGAVCSIGTVLLSVLSTKEIPPTEEELAEIRSKPKGLVPAVAEIASAVRAMPLGMHKIGIVFAFQWYAMFIYWQFVATSIGETAFNASPDEPRFQEAVGWVGAMNGTYNFVTIFAALGLIAVAARFGARWIHAAALAGAAVGLIALSQIGNQYLALVPMVLLGIAWASMMGIPYILVASMVPKERTGVYMGIVNMMIVVPMLLETLTFGWIFEHLLGGDGTNAIMFAGVLLGCGALAMTWVNPPPETEESPIMPLGTPREITVYDRVVVGSDGTPASLKTVEHAAGVADAADAQLVVVTAYTPESERKTTATGKRVPGVRQLLYGEDAARAALRTSVNHLAAERVRNIEGRIVEGDPAKALLEVAGSNPANVIVVGNRGLGAADGQLLGSVPGDVAKNAACDVLIVQTGGEENGTPAQDGQPSGGDSRTML